METGRMNLRDVPLDVIDHYKERAAQTGKSMSTYVVEHLTEAARKKPTQAELLASFAGRSYSRSERDAFDAAIDEIRNEGIIEE